MIPGQQPQFAALACLGDNYSTPSHLKLSVVAAIAGLRKCIAIIANINH